MSREKQASSLFERGLKEEKKEKFLKKKSNGLKKGPFLSLSFYFLSFF